MNSTSNFIMKQLCNANNFNVMFCLLTENSAFLTLGGILQTKYATPSLWDVWIISFSSSCSLFSLVVVVLAFIGMPRTDSPSGSFTETLKEKISKKLKNHTRIYAVKTKPDYMFYTNLTADLL